MEKIKERAGRPYGKIRKRRRRTRLLKRWAMVLLGCALMIYMAGVWRYRSVFLPNTIINGVDVSGKDIETAEKQISDRLSGYQLTIVLRDRDEEFISGTDINMGAVFDGSLEAIKEKQSPFAWIVSLFHKRMNEAEETVTYDEEQLVSRIQEFVCLDEEKEIAPADAKIAYTAGEGCVIIPEEKGNIIDRDKLATAVSDAVIHLQTELDLEEAGVYLEPAVCADSSELVREKEILSPVLNLVVTYEFGDKREVLDGEQIQNWVHVEDGELVLDEGKVEEYVKTLASRCNTAYTVRNFKTSYGKTIQIRRIRLAD